MERPTPEQLKSFKSKYPVGPRKTTKQAFSQALSGLTLLNEEDPSPTESKPKEDPAT